MAMADDIFLLPVLLYSTFKNYIYTPSVYRVRTLLVNPNLSKIYFYNNRAVHASDDRIKKNVHSVYSLMTCTQMLHSRLQEIMYKDSRYNSVSPRISHYFSSAPLNAAKNTSGPTFL